MWAIIGAIVIILVWLFVLMPTFGVSYDNYGASIGGTVTAAAIGAVIGMSSKKFL